MRIHHVTVTVPTQEVARAFYGGVLGLAEIEKPEGVTATTTWFRLGAHELHVTVEPEQPRSRRHLALEVNDLEAVRSRLIAAGVEVDDRAPLPGFRDRCFLRDPAGNRIELVEPDR